MPGLVLLLLLVPQDAEFEAYVRRLGDADAESRERAAQALRDAGPRAREALLRAKDHVDPEIAGRVRSLLDECERQIAHAEIEKRERPRKLRLVNIDASAAPIGEVLKSLEAQTGLTWTPNNVRLDRPVTLQAKAIPLVEALERLGVSCDSNEADLYEGTGQEPRVFTEGVRFAFKTRPWKPEPGVMGRIFITSAVRHFEGDLEWEVAAVQAGKEFAVETCDRHSPGLVYVPGELPAAPSVRIKGLRRWYCPTPVEFRKPKEGMTSRVGSFELTVRWPKVEVRASRAIPSSALKRTLSYDDIEFKLKPGRVKDLIGVGGGGGGGGGVKGMRVFNRTWCGCDGHPERGTKKPVPIATLHAAEGKGASWYELGDIETIVVTFHKPVEEPFEVSSPVLD